MAQDPVHSYDCTEELLEKRSNKCYDVIYFPESASDDERGATRHACMCMPQMLVFSFPFTFMRTECKWPLSRVHFARSSLSLSLLEGTAANGRERGRERASQRGEGGERWPCCTPSLNLLTHGQGAPSGVGRPRVIERLSSDAISLLAIRNVHVQ